MFDVDVSRWQFCGATTNSKHYVVEPHVLAAVPEPGVIDTEANARENVAFQLKWLEENAGGAVLVFFDRLSFQEKAAREVYQSIDSKFFRASALIGGKAIQRTLASFFLSLFRPKIPLQLFADVPSALEWVREINRKAEGAGGVAASPGN